MTEPDIGYLVMERVYDYNGDQYWPHECSPVKFFWDSDKASELAKKLAAETLNDITLYGYELCEITSKDTETVQKELSKLGYDWGGYYDELDIPRMSLEKRIKLIEIFDLIETFYVKEIEVEE